MAVIVFVSFSSSASKDIAMVKRVRREIAPSSPDRAIVVALPVRPAPRRKPIEDLPAHARRAVSVLTGSRIPRRRRG